MNIFRLFNKNKPYKIAKTLECGFLSVGDGHEMYYELSGNRSGIPVVVIHGGPGGYMSSSKRRLFNPKKYFMIHYDQRSCGKSKYSGNFLENNTTDHLLDDLEKLRKHLNIPKWVIYGVSWGASLALGYTVKNKEKVLGLILGGVMLTSKKEILETYSPDSAAASVYPEYYAKFIDPLNLEEKKEPLFAYITKINAEKDSTKKENLIKKLARWESLLVPFAGNIKRIDFFIKSDGFDCNMILLELYYFKNGCFINSEKLLKDLSKLSDIPTYIIQGRYDLLCPAHTAYKVHKTIKGSKIAFCVDGHSIKSKNGVESYVLASNSILEDLKNV
ncbi:MAG: alpha/beta fold hydrolase [Proteobacteria bacterium]|nr:alpha/beta fold hydrolase [Pseudomonadota bacterium]